MCEKTIAQKNAERIAPAGIQGGLPPPTLGLIHDIVVHEGGDVDEFDDDSKIDMSRIDFSGCATGQKGKQRPQTFTAATNSISHITLDIGIKSRRLLDDPFFNFFQLWLDQLRHPSQRAERRSACRSTRP